MVGVVLFLWVFPKKYDDSINKYSKQYGVEKELVFAVARCESGFDRFAISKRGAVGVMQVMPSTAKWCCSRIGIEYDYDRLYEADYNIMIGVFYLSYLFERFGGDTDSVVQAYNAGETVVKKWQRGEGCVYPETAEYLKRVKLCKRIYKYL